MNEKFEGAYFIVYSILAMILVIGWIVLPYIPITVGIIVNCNFERGIETHFMP